MTNQTDQMTQQLQAVIAFSHEFAETHSLHHITPEILLLGVLQQEKTLATQALDTLAIPIDKLRMKIVDSLPPVATIRTENIVLTPRSVQIIDLAFGEA